MAPPATPGPILAYHQSAKGAQVSKANTQP
jgi:hypothetical protein